MRRVIVPSTRYSDQLAPGVLHQRFYPGGLTGPNGELGHDLPGGQAWSDLVLLGTDQDSFKVTVPDIRMPANQFWPLHWHDCWIAVVVLEGTCLVGDWYMRPGDVLVTAAELEYGPLISGPQGCRLFEIFAKHHLGGGGYAPEFRDHPTLQGVQVAIRERSALNKRNDGRQSLPLDGVDGIIKGHLSPDAQWDLGDAADPDRGVMKDSRFAAGTRLGPHSYDDWHMMIVLDGSLEIAGRPLVRDDFLVIQPRAQVAEIVAGPRGAQVFEISRTARGMIPRAA